MGGCWGDRRIELRGVERGETAVRVYCVCKESIFN